MSQRLKDLADEGPWESWVKEQSSHFCSREVATDRDWGGARVPSAWGAVHKRPHTLVLSTHTPRTPRVLQGDSDSIPRGRQTHRQQSKAIEMQLFESACIIYKLKPVKSEDIEFLG